MVYQQHLQEIATAEQVDVLARGWIRRAWTLARASFNAFSQDAACQPCTRWSSVSAFLFSVSSHN